MSPAYTYTIASDKSPSFTRSLIIRLENALVFIGFIVGLMLIFENLSKLVNGDGMLALQMLFLSLVLWFGGYMSRFYFTKRWGGYVTHEFKEKVRVEVLYFLFCYTFTTMFSTTFLRYVPGFYYKSGLSSYTFLTEYLNGTFIVTLLLNLIIFIVFLLGILSFCEFIFHSFFGGSRYYSQNMAKYRASKVFLVAATLFSVLLVMQIPFIHETLAFLHDKTLYFFTRNLRWIFDYLLIFPIFYYLFVSFVGSLSAEKFSVSRRLL